MSYLLDTNVCIRLLRTGKSAQQAQQAIRRRLDAAEAAGHEVATCSIVRLELLVGARRSADPEGNQARVEAFLQQFATIPFDDRAADVGARVRAGLQATGLAISPLDTLISAIALARNLTLVTHNVSELARVQGLTIEDWESA